MGQSLCPKFQPNILVITVPARLNARQLTLGFTYVKSTKENASLQLLAHVHPLSTTAKPTAFGRATLTG
jgi:hypothetical protein